MCLDINCDERNRCCINRFSELKSNSRPEQNRERMKNVDAVFFSTKNQNIFILLAFGHYIYDEIICKRQTANGFNELNAVE